VKIVSKFRQPCGPGGLGGLVPLLTELLLSRRRFTERAALFRAEPGLSLAATMSDNERDSMPGENNHDSDEALLLGVQRDLAGAFQRSLGERLQEIERLAQVVRASPLDPQASGRLHITVHSLAGAAAVYGFSEIAKIARDFDMYLVKRFRTGVLSVPLPTLNGFLSNVKQVASTPK